MATGGSLCGLIADRGFASKKNHGNLMGEEIFDGLCPRNPKELQERLQTDEVFAAAQQRRGQSEGRIGILKNNFLDKVPRSKGFTHRSLQVSWAVLAHNLWVVARLPWAREKEKELPLAA